MACCSCFPSLLWFPPPMIYWHFVESCFWNLYLWPTMFFFPPYAYELGGHVLTQFINIKWITALFCRFLILLNISQNQILCPKVGGRLWYLNKCQEFWTLNTLFLGYAPSLIEKSHLLCSNFPLTSFCSKDTAWIIPSGTNSPLTEVLTQKNWNTSQIIPSRTNCPLTEVLTQKNWNTARIIPSENI